MAILNIFISHKHEDNPTALAVRDILRRYGGNQIQTFVSSDIPAGVDWFDCIRKQLIDSNLLLLLFTDKKLSWDWCLYEAGMFTRLDGESHRRVICLHSPDLPPPEPLKHLQAVSASSDNIRKFLYNLYCTNIYTQADKPINPYLNLEELERAAKDLSSRMGKKPQDVRHFSKLITLHVQNVSEITPDCIPGDAHVIADQTSLELFDKLQGSWKWKDLESEARKNSDQRWLKELAKSIYRASQRNPLDPMFATFSALRGSKVYQPILYRADWEQDGSIYFRILFQEEPSWRIADIPDTIAVLQTAQNMALRFRYEVLQKYLSVLNHNLSTNDLSEIRMDLRDVIQNIEQEAASRGLLEEEKLLHAFKTTRDRNTIAAMYKDWYTIRTTLDKALEHDRAEEIKHYLLRLMRHNNVFIPLAARRYNELMVEMISQETVRPSNDGISSVKNGGRPKPKPRTNSPPAACAITRRSRSRHRTS